MPIANTYRLKEFTPLDLCKCSLYFLDCSLLDTIGVSTKVIGHRLRVAYSHLSAFLLSNPKLGLDNATLIWPNWVLFASYFILANTDHTNILFIPIILPGRYSHISRMIYAYNALCYSYNGVENIVFIVLKVSVIFYYTIFNNYLFISNTVMFY